MGLSIMAGVIPLNSNSKGTNWAPSTFFSRLYTKYMITMTTMAPTAAPTATGTADCEADCEEVKAGAGAGLPQVEFPDTT